MTRKTKTNAKNATGIMQVMTKMGDTLNDMWETTSDRKDASVAIAAYRTAIQTAKTQAYHRKNISSKKRITFLD